MQQINSLDDVTQKIFILRYFEEMQLKEIATIMDMNLNTVKTKIDTCRTVGTCKSGDREVFRSYEENTEDMNISVEIPSVEMIAEDHKELEKSLNEEIYEKCENYAEEAIERAEEYREAFLATGK